jgi:hypothetical protein
LISIFLLIIKLDAFARGQPFRHIDASGVPRAILAAIVSLNKTGSCVTILIRLRRACAHIMKNADQICQSGFACTLRTNQCNGFSFIYFEMNIMQNVHPFIGKTYIPVFNGIIECFNGYRVGGFKNNNIRM